jgi:hypothetical protein
MYNIRIFCTLYAHGRILVSPITNLPSNRLVAVFVLLTFCVSVGCSTWRGMPVANVMSDDAESLVGKHVRLHTKDGVQEITVKKVESPYIEGISRADDSTRIRVHLREVQRMEVYGKSTGVSLLRLGELILFAVIAVFFVRSIAR